MEKNKIIIVAVVLVLLLLGGIYFLQTRSGGTPTTTNEEDLDVIPTVDASVKVNLERTKPYEVQLTVAGIPAGTTGIYYELSYETKEEGLQGAYTPEPVPIKSGQKTFERDIELRTCSAGGACINHELTGAVTVQVKFQGDYGERLFEGEFEL